MGAPGDVPAFDENIAIQAAEHFKARKKQRDAKEKAVDNGEYDKAEGAKRMAARANRLLASVEGAVAKTAAPPGRELLGAPPRVAPLPDKLHELIQHGPVTPETVTEDFLERVIGETRDFLAIDFFEKGTLASRAVCRIVTNLGGGRRGLGTGFMVTRSLLMTNHHVLDAEDTARRSVVEFNFQLGDGGVQLPIERFNLKPDAFFLTDKDLDFALVAVESGSSSGAALASFGYCPLIGAEGKILVRDPVNIIQHPKGELKQIAIRNNTLLDLPEQPPLDRFAHYETDTEQGSSGSPVFNDQWEVIALHHSGVPRINAAGQILDRNGNPWPSGGDPDDIDWISNEGVRTSRLVAFIKAAKVREHEKALQADFIAISSGNVPMPIVAAVPAPERKADERPVVPVRRSSRPSIVPEAVGPQFTGASFTLPLTISIGVGAQPELAARVQPEAAAADAFEASVQPDPDYTDRPGFDPEFLGFSAPLPTLMPQVRDLALPTDHGIELKYYHYSVIMNAERRLAFVSAVNLDGGAPFQLHREAKDRWFFDPRIDKDEQTGPKLYVGNPLDRGHLTRRADAAWGETEDEARLANDDTFHWTNCSPQHEVFNQSTKANQKGLLLWGNLENHVAEQAGEGKLSVFNGPIFRTNDRLHRGVKIPREFYKLIVYAKDNGTPGAVAFILSQKSLIRNLPAEAFEAGPYEPFQVKIADLQNRIKLDFGTFAAFDPLAAIGHELFMEGATADVIALEGLSDIVL
jgi:endonuclease G